MAERLGYVFDPRVTKDQAECQGTQLPLFVPSVLFHLRCDPLTFTEKQFLLPATLSCSQKNMQSSTK